MIFKCDGQGGIIERKEATKGRAREVPATQIERLLNSLRNFLNS